ncbi:MAG: sugar ABC transporter permease [Lachnospiraceae bacterium]|nr:sugar ABC transporter permease [Lachnospiraceae bacterium]
MKKTAKYGRLEKKNFKWIYLFLLPTVIIFVMFYVQPIFVMAWTSFTKWDGFNSPSFIGIRNYVRIFTNSSASASMRNLILWALIAMTLHVGFGVLVAFVLFYKPHGWKFTRSVFMIPNIISAAAWALIYRFIFNDQVGILNAVIRVFNKNFSVQWFYQSPYAFWAVTFTWLFYAVIVTLIVLNDLMSVPGELLEAAKLDGASGGQIVRFVQLPLCRISIGTAMLCSITSRISMYEAIALTTSGGPGDDTMSFSVLLVRAITDYNYGFANAIGVVMFIFGLIVMLVVNRAFRMNDSIY